jgi:histidyl-tRNA synthetase
MEKPSLPRGTRDFGPEVMARRQYLMRTIREVFEKYGFQPLETPAMENLSTLTGKYGDEGDQLLFRILNSGDYLREVPEELLTTRNSKSVVPYIAEKGLRYDLTVPFARYVVMNRSNLTLPFRRYQIQPVWRADRPQKGRYREFYQCDADVVGTNSLLCEAEIILMIREILGKLRIPSYAIRINHRDILYALARQIGADDRSTDLFVALDKLDKAGREGVEEELINRGFAQEKINHLFALLETGSLQKLSQLLPPCRGIQEVQQVFTLLQQAGSDAQHLVFDPSLARGLTYYTGCIFEVRVDHVSVGSVSGGGRYDHLTQAFGAKENLSGVGISFGIDRLYDVMEMLNLFPVQSRVVARALVCHMDEPTFAEGLRLVQQLRQHNIAAELYPDLTKLKRQLDYANKKQIPYAIILGPDEINRGEATLKNLESGEQQTLAREQLITILKP